MPSPQGSPTDTTGPLKMGDITVATGVSDQAVRYYERLGLVQVLRRTSGGFRVFPPGTIRRIRLIKEAQACGFSLGEIRLLVEGPSARTGGRGGLARMLAAKAADLDQQLARLRHFRQVVHALEQACAQTDASLDLEALLLAHLAPSPRAPQDHASSL